MDLSDKQRAVIAAYKDNPTDATALYRVGAIYWEVLGKIFCDAIRDKKDLTEMLTKECEWIDYGVCAELLTNYNDVHTAIQQQKSTLQQGGIPVLRISSWITNLLKKINSGNRKEALEHELKIAHMHIKRIAVENEQLQAVRKQFLVGEVLTKDGVAPDSMHLGQCDTLEELDNLLCKSIRVKKSLAKGVFFSVAQKREHVEREQKIQSEHTRMETFMTKIATREQHTHVRGFSAAIVDNFGRTIDLEDSIVKMNGEIADIEKKQETISAVEVEAKTVAEIDYLKDLLKLSAKRLHTESCAFVRDNDHFFATAEVVQCLSRIIEFDPMIFHNDRVSVFGRPSVLLCPGNGNALFDWKNNCIIVPCIPPGGNFMASMATGLIEYRLDVDEDKRLINSYNTIPEHKDIKSIIQIRSKLTKDYVTWMTAEYKGFRVLGKAVRQWFEHEIAPDKNEIYTPLGLQPFELSAEDFKLRREAVEKRLKENQNAPAIDDLWAGHIFAYQQGKFDVALANLEKFLKAQPDHIFGLYNYSLLCMKSMRKSEATDGFTRFIKLHPQSWWAGVARDHVRKLMG